MPPLRIRLAEGRRVAEQVQADRRQVVIGALFDGVTPEEFTAALGWTLTDLAVAVNRWASKLREDGWITEQVCASLLARFVVKADR